jgi:hypothetical protein
MFVSLRINILVLHTSSKPLDHDIVKSPPFFIHADANIACLKHTGKSIACQLHPLIDIEDVGTPFESALSSASKQNLVSSIFESCHLITYRLYQSIIANRHPKPFTNGTYVFNNYYR